MTKETKPTFEALPQETKDKLLFLRDAMAVALPSSSYRGIQHSPEPTQRIVKLFNKAVSAVEETASADTTADDFARAIARAFARDVSQEIQTEAQTNNLIQGGNWDQ